MGAWGTGGFENDGAADFAWEIAEGGLPVIEKAFDSVLAAGESYLEDGDEAIAAAEVVAKLSGRGPSPLDDLQSKMTVSLTRSSHLESGLRAQRRLQTRSWSRRLVAWSPGSSPDLRSSWIYGAIASILKSGSAWSTILQSVSPPTIDASRP